MVAVLNKARANSSIATQERFKVNLHFNEDDILPTELAQLETLPARAKNGDSSYTAPTEFYVRVVDISYLFQHYKLISIKKQAKYRGCKVSFVFEKARSDSFIESKMQRCLKKLLEKNTFRAMKNLASNQTILTLLPFTGNVDQKITFDNTGELVIY
jgi:hypothetical protein